jgi:hypothetical protein
VFRLTNERRAAKNKQNGKKANREHFHRLLADFSLLLLTHRCSFSLSRRGNLHFLGRLFTFECKQLSDLSGITSERGEMDGDESDAECSLCKCKLFIVTFFFILFLEFFQVHFQQSEKFFSSFHPF